MGKWSLYCIENIHNLVIHNHHLIRKHHMYFPNRLSSKEIYNFTISQKEEKTSSRLYYWEKFNDNNLDWKNIYLLVHIVTKVSKLFDFQFNTVLYLNKIYFNLGKIGLPLHSFCNSKDETTYHLFYECSYKNYLWNQLPVLLSDSLNIPPLTPKIDIFSLIS